MAVFAQSIDVKLDGGLHLALDLVARGAGGDAAGRFYPEGIMALSPGLRGTSYPGCAARKGPQPCKGCVIVPVRGTVMVPPMRAANGFNRFQGWAGQLRYPG